MKKISLKCPQCNNKVNIPIDWEHMIFYCTNCGGKMEIDNEVIGDNFPAMKRILDKTFCPELEEIKNFIGNKITENDIEHFKLDLEIITFDNLLKEWSIK